MTRAPLLALLLVLPAYAGCLSDDAPAPEAAVAAKSAEQAGAAAGEAPVAPKEAYVVDGARTAYPVPIETNAARAPVTLDLSGVFTQQDCRPLNFGGMEAALTSLSAPQRFHDLSEAVQVGDVFAYDVLFSYANRQDNWGEIHAAYGFGSTIEAHAASTQAMTEVVANWSGQGYRASDEDQAWVWAGCDYGLLREPIPYTLTVTLRFAEGAVPAQAPIAVPVPEGATKLFVRGVPVDAAEGVQSHFRVFAPDDTLVCECALGSDQEVAEVALPGPGEYVLLVDHTANGFVSVALDAPPTEPMRALATEWAQTSVLVAEGGPVDETIDLDLPRVPLHMHAMVLSHEAGAGKRTQLVVSNARGEVLRQAWGGHVTWQGPGGGTAWLGIWPTDWVFAVDHHAFAPGVHTAKVTAEHLRGEVLLVTRQYVR